MKAKYLKPSIAVIVMGDLCESDGLTAATVETEDHKHIDHFDVIGQDKSQNEYDWGPSSWGGN